jgi:hypothetical protein
MPNINHLNALKGLNLTRARVSLVILEKYISQRVAHYRLKNVQTNDPLKAKLRQIVLEKIQATGLTRRYTVDAEEPDEDEACLISVADTDFQGIYDQLLEMNPEEDRVEHAEELSSAKAYMIVLTAANDQRVIGLRKIPESWKLKGERGLIQVLFRENRFEDLTEGNVFSISDTVDMLFYNDRLLIYSLKAFENLLNFREAMIATAQSLYDEVQDLEVFTNVDMLQERVTNNRRYLRKISVIQTLGYYRDPAFIQRLKAVNVSKGWNIQFENDQITFTEETIDTILTVLQDKRLHSLLTDQDFDVPSATKVE